MKNSKHNSNNEESLESSIKVLTDELVNLVSGGDITEEPNRPVHDEPEPGRGTGQDKTGYE